MKNNIGNAKNKYPSISELDLHYYGLKGYGIKYDNSKIGRPKLHLIDTKFLFSVVPLFSEQNSPYELRDTTLKFCGEELPFRVKYIKHVKDKISYYYIRGIEEWIQTLDSEISLNTNFQPSCKGCSFCTRITQRKLKNINPQEGLELIIKEGIDLSKVNEIAIVTGMFSSESEIVEHISRISEIASRFGFRGKLFYIGSQIKTKIGIINLLNGLNGIPFRYAYTLETFTNRDKLHSLKRDSIEEAVNHLSNIKNEGITNLEYTYIPGIDDLNEFYKESIRLKEMAIPHLSIFRPATQKQKSLSCKEFTENPIDYLCRMRLFFEDLYGKPIYGNNLANLWGFPNNRINPILLTDKIQVEEKQF